jgi:precorrin-6Y C5,15-methyltransferase (decarboxylating)
MGRKLCGSGQPAAAARGDQEKALQEVAGVNFTLGLSEDLFEQRKPKRGLITKTEVRVVSLAKMNLRQGYTVWDIGTATGSVAIEAARLIAPGPVFAIEKNEEDVGIARRNVERFEATNVTVVHGKAPAGLDQWPDPDAVFIGGSSGSMAALVRLAVERLKPGGRVVVNAATLENLHECVTGLKDCGWHADVVLMQVSRSRPILNLTRFESFDPVYIVTGSAETSPAPAVGDE